LGPLFVRGKPKHYSPAEIKKRTKRLAEARKKRWAKKRYGTIEKYFYEGLGIDVGGQKALRDLYLEKK
jgi:hypothetical protein